MTDTHHSTPLNAATNEITHSSSACTVCNGEGFWLLDVIEVEEDAVQTHREHEAPQGVTHMAYKVTGIFSCETETVIVEAANALNAVEKSIDLIKTPHLCHACARELQTDDQPYKFCVESPDGTVQEFEG